MRVAFGVFELALTAASGAGNLPKLGCVAR